MKYGLFDINPIFFPFVYHDFMFQVKQPASSSDDYKEGSSIYDYICPDVLAQHGGELLLHSTFYSKSLFGGKCHSNIRTFPGMIVLGTKVCKCNYKHNSVNTIPI